jgi:hypothetical protein
MIHDDVGEENGWIVEFNSIKKKFLVWDNVERQIMGEHCSAEVDTLEEVFDLVNSYT